MTDFSNIGEKLKNIRNGMGLSLSEVANLTGVSKAMLSQIERSDSVPTLATTWKIVTGLRIKLDALLEDPDRLYDVKSYENAPLLTDDDEHFRMYCLFPFSPISGYDLCYGIIKPGCHYDSGKHINIGTEHLLVTQGELELVIGSNTYHIKAGSAIAFDSQQPHVYVNNGDTDVIVCLLTSQN